MATEQDLVEQIQEILERSEFSFQREPSIGGLRPDFALDWGGQLAILEVKNWQSTPRNEARAAEQAESFRRELGAVEAFVVLPEPVQSDASSGVSSVDDLLEKLRERRKWRHKGAVDPAPVFDEAQPIMFCAMPFDEAYEDVFFVGMRQAAASAGVVATRVDQDEFNGNIVQRIHEMIDEADLLVADLSEGLANVMYEIGYAVGSGKPVIHICSTPFGELPFDVAQTNTIKYAKGQIHRLGDALAKRIEATI